MQPLACLAIHALMMPVSGYYLATSLDVSKELKENKLGGNPERKELKENGSLIVMWIL